MEIDSTVKIVLALISLIGGMVAVSRLAVVSLAKVILNQSEDSAAERRLMVAAQDRIALTLENHLASIGKNLVLLNDKQDLMGDKMLDVILRLAERADKSSSATPLG